MEGISEASTLVTRYCVTAGGLGFGWFLVLLIPGITRTWLLSSVGVNIACLIAASVVVALLLRRFIESAETFPEHLLRAMIVPLVGCFVFLSLWNAAYWGKTLLWGGLANIHDTLSLYVMGILAAVVSFLVVIPYGLLCQYVMSREASSRRDTGALSEVGRRATR